MKCNTVHQIFLSDKMDICKMMQSCTQRQEPPAKEIETWKHSQVNWKND